MKYRLIILLFALVAVTFGMTAHVPAASADDGANGGMVCLPETCDPPPPPPPPAPPPPPPAPMPLIFDYGYSYTETGQYGQVLAKQSADGLPVTSDYYVISQDGQSVNVYSPVIAASLLPDIEGLTTWAGGLRSPSTYHCHHLDLWKTAHQSDVFFHPIVWRFHHTKVWCTRYPSIVSVTDDSFFDHIDSQFRVVYDDHGIDADHYYSWRGSTTGGHFSRRQGMIDNCLLRWGCIGSHYPQIQIHVNGNGAFAALYH